jgi:uncharacterized protein YdhG (YjbR/CyaY superfamily)
MKKQKPTSRSSSAKRSVAKGKTSKPNAKTKTVAEYVARVPKPARAAFAKLRAAVRSAVPRTAAEIISYQIPAFKDARVLVWFAAFSSHCSLFPTNSVIQKFEDELKDFSISKGTVQFPLDKPLPISLIKRMVKARVAEVTETK